MVARHVRDVEAASSSLATSTRPAVSMTRTAGFFYVLVRGPRCNICFVILPRSQQPTFVLLDFMLLLGSLRLEKIYGGIAEKVCVKGENKILKEERPSYALEADCL